MWKLLPITLLCPAHCVRFSFRSHTTGCLQTVVTRMKVKCAFNHDTRKRAKKNLANQDLAPKSSPSGSNKEELRPDSRGSQRDKDLIVSGGSQPLGSHTVKTIYDTPTRAASSCKQCTADGSRNKPIIKQIQFYLAAMVSNDNYSELKCTLYISILSLLNLDFSLKKIKEIEII